MKKFTIFSLMKQTLKSWSDDNIMFVSAALAYYTTFSLAPLIVISIAIAGFFFGKEAVQSELLAQISATLGAASESQIKVMIAKAMSPATSILTQIIGVIVLIFGASGVFGALQTGLNIVWQVKLKSDRGIVKTIKDRFLSFTMVLGVSFLLLVSMVITVLISAASNLLNNYITGGDFIAMALNFVVSTAMITVLFAMLFKYLPDAKIRWSDVWLGSFLTTLLFTLGKFLLGIYLKFADIGSDFGAASSLILILVWFFYTAQIFFLGAEFTKTYTSCRGRPIIPAKDALLITTQK